MDAIILAGGIPQPEEPLYTLTQGQNKALLEIAGKPLIQWVIDAFNDAHGIETITVVGLDKNSGLQSQVPIYYTEAAGSMFDNARAGIAELREHKQESHYLLMSSSDIPTLTGEIVDWIITQTDGVTADAFYLACNRPTMDARFPNSNRSFYKLKDMEICGSDIHVFAANLADQEDTLWISLMNERKNAFKQARIIGFGTLFSLLFRTATLQSLAKAVGGRLGLKAIPVLSPYAETAMDVDKPHQYDMLKADLENRQTS